MPSHVWTNRKGSIIQHFSMPLPLALKISGKLLLPLIYFIIWTNLSQSPLSGSIILVVMSEILVQVSVLARLVVNNILPPGDETPQLVWD